MSQPNNLHEEESTLQRALSLMSTASSSVARSSTAAASGQGLSGGGEGESTSGAGSPFSLVDSGGGVSHGTEIGGASTLMRDATEGSNTSAFVTGLKGLFGAVGASLAGRVGTTPLATFLASTREHTSPVPVARDGPSPSGNLQQIMDQSTLGGISIPLLPA